jgi:hypothetical protein
MHEGQRNSLESVETLEKVEGGCVVAALVVPSDAGGLVVARYIWEGLIQGCYMHAHLFTKTDTK